MKKCAILTAMLLIATSAFAVDLNGKWIAQITNPQGNVSERVFTLQASGASLNGTIVNLNVAPAIFEQPGKPTQTGTLKTQQGSPQTITEATVSGNDITFVVVSQVYSNQVRTTYTGKVAGNEIDFTVETKFPPGATNPGGQPMNSPAPQQIVAKRVGK